MRNLLSKPWAHLALITMAVFALYAWTLPFEFQFDDELNFLGNSGVDSLKLMYASSAEQQRAGLLPVFYHHFRVRGLPYLSFWANTAAGGKGDPWQWRLVNIALHAAMSCLVYLFTMLIFRMPRLSGSSADGRVKAAALAAAMLYAAHPLNSETAIYVSARIGQMAAFFYLASVVLYMTWRASARRMWLWVSLATALCAMFSKETAFTLPIMIALIEWACGDGRGMERWGGAAMHLCLLPVIPLAKLTVQTASGVSEGFTSLLSGMPRSHYLYTQFKVVLGYLGLTFWPRGLTVNHYVTVNTSALSASTLIPLAALCAIAALGFVALWHGKRRPALLVSAVGIFGFFIALSVESTVFPIIVLMEEYRTYLPLAFLLPGVAAGGAARLPSGRPAAIAAGAAVCAVIALAGAAVDRSADWRTESTLWLSALKDDPMSARNNSKYALALCKEGKTQECFAQMDKTVRLLPRSFLARYAAGTLYMSYGKPELALPNLEAASGVIDSVPAGSSQYNATLLGLAEAYLKLGRPDDARKTLDRLIAVDPRQDEAQRKIHSLKSDIEKQRAPQ